MRKIIFASHGSLCEGMKDSIGMIAGPLAEKIETLPLLPGQNPQDLYLDLKKRIESSSDQYVILCDILGGSVHTCLSQLAQLDNAVIYSGMNMGMGLDLVLQDDSIEILPEQFESLADKGRQGITLIQKLTAVDDEEF